MYTTRFRESLGPGLSLEQIRGLEGVRVRQAYRHASQETSVPWHGRRFGAKAHAGQDTVNIALSAAAEALYGVCHAVAVQVGWIPALGVIHTGTSTSFVLDIADLYRTQLIIPVAFQVASSFPDQPGATDTIRSEARTRLRERLTQERLLARMVADLDAVMSYRSPADPGTDAEPLDGLKLWDPAANVPAGHQYDSRVRANDPDH